MDHKKDAIPPRFDVSPNYYTQNIISNRVTTSRHNMVSVKLGLGPFLKNVGCCMIGELKIAFNLGPIAFNGRRLLENGHGAQYLHYGATECTSCQHSQSWISLLGRVRQCWISNHLRIAPNHSQKQRVHALVRQKGIRRLQQQGGGRGQPVALRVFRMG